MQIYDDNNKAFWHWFTMQPYATWATIGDDVDPYYFFDNTILEILMPNLFIGVYTGAHFDAIFTQDMFTWSHVQWCTQRIN